ncbi:unnamed protein product [Calicophoron daubneyi]
MPSTASQSRENKLDDMYVPVGSEKIVQIRRRQKSGDPTTAQPIDITTSERKAVPNKYEYESSTKRMSLSHSSKHRLRRERSEPQRMSLFSPRRKSTVKSNGKPERIMSCYVIPDIPQQREKVISTLEMEVPEPAKGKIYMERDPSRNESWTQRQEKASFSFDRFKNLGSKEREYSIPIDDPDDQDFKYSRIFDAEYGRRSGLRPRAQSTIFPLPSTPAWSPYMPSPMKFCPNCMTSTCYQCKTVYVPQNRSSSQEFLNNEIPEVPYYGPGQRSYYRGSSDDIGRLSRRAQHITPYPVSHVSMPMPGEGHMHAFNRLYTPSRSRLNLSTYDVNDELDEDAEKPVDLLEIEYTSFDDDQDGIHLSSKSLNAIVKLAQKASLDNDRLEEIAEKLKMSLDETFGAKWHVVVGTDSFGSNLESLPGALANFKVDKNVFLVWRT